MDAGTSAYGVPDIVYDIVTTVGNLLQGEEKLREYAGDASAAGDAEAAQAFTTIADANRIGAQVLLRRLKAHLPD